MRKGKPNENLSSNIYNSNLLEKKDFIGSEEIENIQIKIRVNGHEWVATLEDNPATRALVEKLRDTFISILMKDYAGFEKVGDLGFNLPQNNPDISTGPGDLVLYQGRSFVIYYGMNQWRLTHLGKIKGVNKEALIRVLDEGSVTVTLFMN